MDRARGNIVVSRRAVLEETRAAERSEIVGQLQEGEIREGVVKNITDYGAFVDLGGIDGLLHVTDMSWKRVSHPSQVLNVGDTVKVQVVKINPDTQRISLGMKQLQSDPWDGVEAKYPIEGKFTGRVTNITDYGAFVELEPGVEGLVHVSEMSWTKKNVHPGKIISTSQEVDVMILDVEMPELDGVGAIPKVLAAAPGVRILMASTLTQRNAQRLCLGAGQRMGGGLTLAIAGAADAGRVQRGLPQRVEQARGQGGAGVGWRHFGQHAGFVAFIGIVPAIMPLWHAK
jgi:predicted RNA-binding protein with RPS1 domain